MARGRLDAMQAAAEALDELGVDQTQAIDPFPLLERLGLKLSFRPLDGLLGAILNLPNVSSHPGVLISTQRGPGVQRYTAAHEIGHWYLHREQLMTEPAADGVQEIYGRGGPSTPRELEAQLFAAYFLMPLRLVGRITKSYGVRPNGEASPAQVYSIARDMRVSYEAATRQLSNLGFFNRAVRDQLLRVPRWRIKAELAGGRKPTNSGHDVWVVSGERRGPVDPYVGDDVVVRLEENPTTGHRWMSRATYERLTREGVATGAPPAFGNGVPAQIEMGQLPTAAEMISGGELLRPVSDRFVVSESAIDAVGTGGERIVTLVADRQGHWKSDLVYASPFDANAPVRELEFAVDVLGDPQQWAKDIRMASVGNRPR